MMSSYHFKIIQQNHGEYHLELFHFKLIFNVYSFLVMLMAHGFAHGSWLCA